jgi:ubiquinol-cytochrome c reductase cytochrome b subunit
MDFPTPKNLNYWWTFGGILAVCLVVQIVTGIVLAMHYVAARQIAFASVERIMRDVDYGWLIQNIHANGASMFFLAVYIHMFRGLYYGSYKAPREVLWILGVRDLPADDGDGVHGLRAALGPDVVPRRDRHHQPDRRDPAHRRAHQDLADGRFAIDDPTLNRFFSLHYLLPFVIAASSCCTSGRCTCRATTTRPASVKDVEKADTVPFHPYYTVKDGFAIIVFLILFAYFVFYAPNALGHADNSSRPTRCRRRRTSCRNGTCCRSTRSCAPSRSTSARSIAMRSSLGVIAMFAAPSASCSCCRGSTRRRCARCATARSPAAAVNPAPVAAE